HKYIHSGFAYTAPMAGAARRCQDIPFGSVLPQLRRRAHRAKSGRSAIIRLDGRFEMLLASEQYLFVCCAWLFWRHTITTSPLSKIRECGFTLIVTANNRSFV